MNSTPKCANPIIRPLAIDDIPSYQLLRLQGLREHPEAFGETAAHFLTVTKEQIFARLQEAESRGGFILGAFVDDSLKGVVGLVRASGEKMEHRATIWGMYVAPQVRGIGLGKALLSDCITRATRVKDLEQIHLAVTAINESAHSLYRSFGFKEYGREPAALKVGEKRLDEILMFLPLPQR